VSKLKGLIALIGEVVEHGSTAVEKVHLATAGRTFAVVEMVPGIEGTAKLVHEVHDLSVSAVYAGVRGTSAVITQILGAVVD